MKENLKKEKGITLIALVITIIVLLILAGVSIAMLTGDNGILTQVSNAKTDTIRGNVEEMVSVAIGSLQTENLGDSSKITPEMIADQVNEENKRTDVTAEESVFPTNIVFAKEGLKVPVDITLVVGESSESNAEPDADPIYSVDIDESKIAPQEIFNIETEDGKVASITDDSMPTKTAKITGIKSEYCNDFYGEEDTNYEINYNGTKITDTLIIPYKVQVDGEWYVVTEVYLEVQWRNSSNRSGTSGFPQVNTIVYPNTVNNLFRTTSIPYSGGPYNIVLPGNIANIPAYMFEQGKKLVSIDIPKSVTNIGDGAFSNCSKLTTVNYGGTTEEWKKITIGNSNTNLTNAKIICTDGTIN